MTSSPSDGLSEATFAEHPVEKPWCPTRDPASWGLRVGSRLRDFDTGKLAAVVTSIRDGYVWITEAVDPDV